MGADMTMNENDKQAEPVAADHTGLIKRIDAAIERVTQGRGLMSIPADPRSDVDLVLSECKALLQGKNPPFWATEFHPAQPVQPAVAKGEAVDLRELFERLLFGTYAGKDSYYNDEQIKHGCFERAQELVDVAKRMNIALYTTPPAAAINEQLYQALRHLYHNAKKSGAEMGLALDVAEDALKQADKAKGGV